MVSRVVAYVCLSIAGLPLSGGLSSVCLGGAVSFQRRQQAQHVQLRVCELPGRSLLLRPSRECGLQLVWLRFDELRLLALRD